MSETAQTTFKERISYETLLLEILSDCFRERRKGTIGGYQACVFTLLEALTKSLRREVWDIVDKNPSYELYAKIAEGLDYDNAQALLKDLEKHDRHLARSLKECIDYITEKQEECKTKRILGTTLCVVDNSCLTRIEDIAKLNLTDILVETIIDVLEQHGLLLKESELFRGEA